MRAHPSTNAAIKARLVNVIITDRLGDRPVRTPELKAEIECLHRLANALAIGDMSVLDGLSAAAMQLCGADSAGVSLIEETTDGVELFRWVTTAGHCSPFVGGTTPIDDSPCGVTLALGTSQLFSYPQRHFECLRGPEPEVVEGLVAPIPGIAGPIGTLWVMSHTEGRVFDAEHLRIMTSLASFTGAAVQVEQSKATAALRITETEQAAGALRSEETRANDFIAMLSHELRNPIAPIDAAIQTAQRLSSNAPRVQAALTVAQRQMSRLSRLVSDLLDTTRIRQGKISVRMDYAQLADIVGDAVASVQPDITRLEQQLTVNEPPSAVTVYADASRLTQVIANLLSNAVKYTPAGKRIFLDVQATSPDQRRPGGEVAGNVAITITDEGMGIPPDVLPHIFDLYTQSPSNPKRTDGGLGIGLAVVKHLVQLHDGAVEILSAGEGQGTQVKVVLPVIQPAPKLAEPALAEHTDATRILLVDDNADSAEALAMLLELDGHEVRTAFSGPAALAVVETFVPEIAFIDIGMPGMTGIELAQTLRMRKQLAATKLVALTGLSGALEQERLIHVGFAELCTKPLSTSRLYELLRSV